jgi:hypothetical protein
MIRCRLLINKTIKSVRIFLVPFQSQPDGSDHPDNPVKGLIGKSGFINERSRLIMDIEKKK